MDLQALTESIRTFVMTLPGAAGETVESDTPILDLGIVDSMAMQAILAHLAAAYGVVVPPTEVHPESFSSPKAIADLVHRIATVEDAP